MEIPQFKSSLQLSLTEDSFFNFQWPVNSIYDQLSPIDMHHLHAHTPLFEYHDTVMEPSSRPTKQLKTHSNNHSLLDQNQIHGSHNGTTNQATILAGVSSRGTNVFTFNNSPSSYSGKQMTSTSNTTRVTTSHDHILAERKRREKLSQQFIALSALLPNLKKMDKASVLGDAIEYTKILQEKVKNLEEQARKIASIKPVRVEVVVDGGSSYEKISGVPENLPEIEARFSGKNVLIRVQCEKKTGAVENTLAEIEKLHLSVINSTSMIFANSTLHITVIAQMDKDLTMTMEDFVKNLQFGLKK